MVLRCMLVLAVTAPIGGCKLDREEALGAERERPVPYPERLYTPRAPAEPASAQPLAVDGGVPDGAPIRER